MPAFRGQQRPLMGTQIEAGLLFFSVDASESELTEGASDATLTKNGTGDWTITFATPFARTPLVFFGGSTTALINEKIVSKSGTAVRVLTEVAAGTDTDCDFDLMVWGSYDPIKR